MSAVVELETLGASGFKVYGEDVEGFAGASVSNAGDVNGDGYGDFIIGAPRASRGAYLTGSAYLIYGGPNGLRDIDLGNLPDGAGFRIDGHAELDEVGMAVSGAGDVNGDGFDDVIVSALHGGFPPVLPTGFEYFSQPTAYVIYGAESRSGTLDVTSLSASDGFAIRGPVQGVMIQLAVSDAGDINNDGFDEVIVGASYLNSLAGDAYVIFGRDDGYTEVDLTNIGYSGFRISGVHSYDQLGVSLSAAGDVNGDHFADFIIGAEREDSGGTDAGAAYVIFGHDGPFGTIDLATLTPTLGFMIQGSDAVDIAGRSVSGAGDINGDAYSDLIVGEPFGDNGGAESGEAYVIFGHAGNFPSVIDLSNLGSAGFVIQGEFDSHTGHRVSAAGDVNGDGYDDVIISGESSDKIYLIFGHGGPFGTIDLANLQPSAGMVFQAPTNDEYWDIWSVSAAGDVDGDGLDDLLVGSPGDDENGANAGAAYVVFGSASFGHDAANDFNGDGRSDILWRDGTGQLTSWLGTTSGGWVANGANAYNQAPTSWHVAGTGDFNADGRDDLLWRNDNGQLTNWLANNHGGFAGSTTFSVSVANQWHVVGTGDFNEDGRDDILWRNDNGTITDWLANGSGGFAASTTYLAVVPTDWSVAGIGDFNGDGLDDILWRNDNGQLTDWLRTEAGGFTANAFSVFVPTSWTVVGTGDFNDDELDDILWRNDNGTITDWLATGGGAFAASTTFSTVVVTDWDVVGIGDFNGDVRDDILWRHESGHMTGWLGTGGGGFVDNSANASIFVSPAWQVENLLG